MRLFVAVVPPEDALRELEQAARGLRGLPGADELRWTERAGWHLTLAFLGEVPEALLPELGERLDRAARRHEPYDLGLAGAGRFGDRTLWAGLTGGDLRRLAGSAGAAARKAGVEITAEHGFHAHLTLARQRPHGRIPLRPFADELSDFAGTPWTADAITLVRSHAPTPGMPGAQPRYEALRTCPLGR
ncbi:RNA 2',3'-cyclic phosphodiesterase [Streptomyces sp.]